MENKSLKEILMERDKISEGEAEELISEAAEEFYRRMESGEDPSDICEEYLGLESDYLEELLFA